MALSALLVPCVVAGSSATTVATRWGHTCAVMSRGAVQCWGWNQYGEVGDGTTTWRLTPVTVSGLSSGVSTVVAGYSHTCAVTSGGAVECWGRNDSGQLGDASATQRPSPVAVSGLGGTIFRRYFAEGAATSFFDCYFALANPNLTTAANVTLHFLRDDSQTFSYTVQVPAMSRRTVNAKNVPGLTPAFGFSTIVESDVEVVADRTMTWDSTGYGSHAETSIGAPAQTWYLAEGATQNGFQLYYLIENPNPVPVDVTVTYLRRSPDPPFDIVYSGIPAYTRKTIYVNGEDLRLASGDVSGIVTSLTENGPIIVERAMYLNNEGRQFNAGHDSAGVTAPTTDWFLAEGATVRTFDMFILLANPGATDGTATITYMLTDGRNLVKSYPVAAHSRQTVWVNGERVDSDPTFTFSNVSLSAKVHGTVPIIVERAMWWSDFPGGPWIEAHDAVGTTETGTMWAVADGEQGGTRSTDTYVLVANTSPFPGRVRVTLMGEDGSTPSTERDVPANSRTTFWMGGTAVTADSPFGNTLAGKKFGAIVESLPMAQGVAAIVVERAMYSNANGIAWAAGTDVVATKLTPIPPAPTATRLIALSGSLAFGNVLVGTTATAQMVIWNSGNATLTVTGMTGPSGYTANWLSGTIAPGSSQPVTVGLTPSAAGSYDGTITVLSDHTSGTDTIGVSGTGTIVPPPQQDRYVLYGGPNFATYLGCWSCTQYASDSVFNQFGAYGSRFSSTSVSNHFSQYGSPFSSYSACNEFASNPPRIIDTTMNTYTELTLNPFRPYANRDSAVLTWLHQVACER